MYNSGVANKKRTEGGGGLIGGEMLALYIPHPKIFSKKTFYTCHKDKDPKKHY